ncbi:glycosyltransferase family 4 protein [Acetobacter fallax]|uniref:Glycosyltransferase n=1 Tax=Acetobacter fallax TaxID=1737473 RepID=A0ABX0KGV7_9PROT|nr:glycosyltransferase family 1 protein [Acetobacter fallax]NHO33152.1 glycosyltransferase [Acetobacter fallax]NHO36827.1 glycosyltransferase [Acetobacter fallax]
MASLTITGTPRFWIDVEDLFDYARGNARPSGIQRVGFEIYLAMQAQDDFRDRIGFLRHTVSGTGFVTVPWDDVLALYRHLTADTSTPPVIETGSAVQQQPGRLRRLALRLPTLLRVPLGRFIAHQTQAAKDASAMLRASGQILRDAAREKEKSSDQQEFSPSPGDVLLSLGAPWSHSSYASLFQKYRETHGMKTGLLIHDLIPLLWPEWCQPGLPRVFRRWLDALLPECDRIFAVSHSTQRDIVAYASRTSVTLRHPVSVIPMASGFTQRPADDPAARKIASDLGRYVLVTGTMEARKNHALLFRVWRRLILDNPGKEIPKLVFAGSPGWLVDDLLQQIRNSNFLDGHLVLIRSPSDAVIDALSRHCLFTVFPSFYEGWGLPVTESLACGRPCLISDRSSLPEAGQGLVDSFDPDNATEALEKISQLLFDTDALTTAERRVTDGFRPITWSDAARQILTAF